MSFYARELDSDDDLLEFVLQHERDKGTKGDPANEIRRRDVTILTVIVGKGNLEKSSDTWHMSTLRDMRGPFMSLSNRSKQMQQQGQYALGSERYILAP